MPKTYDLIIIGAGTTGLRACVDAANLGKKVAVVENRIVGGTCLNRGCIPSKLLIYGAEILQTLKHANKFGINIKSNKPQISFQQAMLHQRNVINSAQKSAEKNITNLKNVDVYKGDAKFLNKNSIEIFHRKLNKYNEDDVKVEIIKSKNIIIATGGNPITSNIKGIENLKKGINLFDSDNIWFAKKQPTSIVLLGGGYISMEFAFFFAMYGTKVYVINRSERILGREDTEVAKCVEENIKKLGVEIIFNNEIKIISKRGSKFIFNLNNKNIVADALMINAGRHPNSQDLGLERVGIKLDAHDFVKVNDYLQTNVSNIYAIGDVNGLAQFAHTGKYEAEISVNNVFSKSNKNKSKKVKQKSIFHTPYAVFTYPQIGAVGMCEDELIEKKIKYTKLFATNALNGKHKIIKEPEGFVKAMFDKSGKLLGARIVGHNASELIHEFIVLINSEGNHMETLKKSIHIHPTLSESVENLF